jgi:hypothetical protein
MKKAIIEIDFIMKISASIVSMLSKKFLKRKTVTKNKGIRYCYKAQEQISEVQ